MQVCSHFRRVASLEDATAECKFFYTGRLASEETSSVHAAGSHQSLTTSLHDAVKVGNYPVVQYLLQTGFNVVAPDSDGCTAIDLALAKVREPGSPERFEIFDILSQHPSNSKVKLNLPLGWKRFKANQSVDGFVESSVVSIDGIDPITFIRPKVSLLQDRLLALTERAIEGEDDQIFWLNPIRFLRKGKTDDVTIQPATERHLVDDWYHKEVLDTLNPDIKAVDDERRWYRTAAVLFRYLSSVASLRTLTSLLVLPIFVALALASRAYGWSAGRQLALSLLPIGALVPILASATSLLLNLLGVASYDAQNRVVFLASLPDCLVRMLCLCFNP